MLYEGEVAIRPFAEEGSWEFGGLVRLRDECLGGRRG